MKSYQTQWRNAATAVRRLEFNSPDGPPQPEVPDSWELLVPSEPSEPSEPSKSPEPPEPPEPSEPSEPSELSEPSEPFELSEPSEKSKINASEQSNLKASEQPKPTLRRPREVKVRVPREGSSIRLGFLTSERPEPILSAYLSSYGTGGNAYVFASRNFIKFRSSRETTDHFCAPFDLVALLFNALYVIDTIVATGEHVLDYSCGTETNGLTIKFVPSKLRVDVVFHLGRHVHARPLAVDYKITASFESAMDLKRRLSGVRVPYNNVVECLHLTTMHTSSALVHPDFLCCPYKRLGERVPIASPHGGWFYGGIGAGAFDDRPLHDISVTGCAFGARKVEDSSPMGKDRAGHFEWRSFT